MAADAEGVKDAERPGRGYAEDAARLKSRRRLENGRVRALRLMALRYRSSRTRLNWADLLEANSDHSGMWNLRASNGRLPFQNLKSSQVDHSCAEVMRHPLEEAIVAMGRSYPLSK